jgi:hypothetical protein
MSLLKRAACLVCFNGPEAGWLPAGAAHPTAETASLALLIRQTSEGFFLESASSNSRYCGGDTWHASYEEAVAQAQYQFGVPSEAWIDVAA